MVSTANNYCEDNVKYVRINLHGYIQLTSQMCLLIKHQHMHVTVEMCLGNVKELTEITATKITIASFILLLCL